jgi:hypothetical protein
MDDATLIQRFIDTCSVGETFEPLMSANLRIETLPKHVQVLTKRGEVAATAKLGELRLSFVVNHHCCYAPLIHEALIARNFFPVQNQRVPHSYQYFRAEMPAGYKQHWTTVKELWRACWTRGGLSRSGIPMDILIYALGPDRRQYTWCPLRGMDCAHGKLEIKLLNRVESLDPNDMISWIEQVEVSVTRFAPAPEARRVRPDIRPYVRSKV